MAKKVKAVATKGVPKFKVTQSLIKSLRDYQEGKGECGLQIEAKYIKGQWGKFEPSDVMRLGTWFEYMLTEAIPKDGNIPEPVKTKSGSYTAPYERMMKHVANFKMLQTMLGFKILEVGTTWEFEDLAGTLDLLCEATKDIMEDGVVIVKKGQKFIVDIKSTGLLDDKWNDYGWELNNLGNKSKLITQPIHYKYLGKKLYDEDMPFVFFLFHSNNENDFRIINFVVDEDVYPDHEEWINWTRTWMNHYIKNGFTSYLKDQGQKIHPSVKKCAECPLKVGCKGFRVIPKIDTFYHHLANIDEKYNN